MELQDLSTLQNAILQLHDLFQAYCHTGSIILALLMLYIWYFFKRPYNLPPGPYGYPLIGCARELSDQVSKDFARLSDKYGDLFCLWMGGDRYLVILNSYAITKEAYVTRGSEFSDRIPIKSIGGLDITEPLFNGHYGSDHKQYRKIVTNSIRHFISSKLESVAQKEMVKISQCVEEVGDNVPVNISKMMELVMTNIFSAWHFNKTYSFKDPELKDHVNWILQYFTVLECSLSNLFSANTYFSPSVPSGRKNCSDYLNFVKKEIQNHILNLDVLNPQDLVDELLINNLHNTCNSKDDTLHNLIIMLITDATLSVSSTINFIVAYFVHFPEYQKVILQEISHLDLKNGKVSLSHRKKMPFTEAFIMEVQRMSAIFQITAPRTPLQATTLRGYNIPKGVTMITSIEGVHKNPNQFPEPDVFKPERFLKHGQLSPIEDYMPFGLGRRICVGEQIAKNCMFYLFTNLVSNYDIHQDLGTKAHVHGSMLKEVVNKMENFNVMLKKKVL